MDEAQHTIVLGDEYDDALRGALLMVLLDMGAELIDKNWGVGGSQVIEIIDFRLGETVIRVEAETYMGLSISGDTADITEIEQRLLASQAQGASLQE